MLAHYYSLFGSVPTPMILLLLTTLVVSLESTIIMLMFLWFHHPPPSIDINIATPVSWHTISTVDVFACLLFYYVHLGWHMINFHCFQITLINVSTWYFHNRQLIICPSMFTIIMRITCIISNDYNPANYIFLVR